MHQNKNNFPKRISTHFVLYYLIQSLSNKYSYIIHINIKAKLSYFALIGLVIGRQKLGNILDGKQGILSSRKQF